MVTADTEPGFQGEGRAGGIKGEKTLADLAQQFDVHPNQITQWRSQLLDGADDVFGSEAKSEAAAPTIDVKTLHVKIGKLALENDFVRRARQGRPSADDRRQLDRESGITHCALMKPSPTLRDGDYPFREETYPLSELAMSEAPPELANFLVSQAESNGIELIRDQVVELICRGPGIPEQRFTVYWPSGEAMHVLVPKWQVVGRA